MSIATEITRLQNAKSDLATAITNKGVTVPASTTLDGYASLVTAIPTGSTAKGLEHIGSLTTLTKKLSATDYPNWTPSTTASAILATQTLGTFTATNIATHDYWSRIRIYIDIVYPDGTSTAKGRLAMCVGENWYCITRRSSNATNLNASTKNYNLADSVTNIFILKYYNTAWSAAYSSSYGIYPANSAPTLSSTSSASPTVTVNSPVINAKTSATYFSSTYANSLDQDKSTIKFVTDIYRTDTSDSYQRAIIYNSLIDMWNNGL